MAKNKIIFGGEVLIDLTGDTITPADLAYGVTAHDKTGEIITGTSTKDSDTSDATALAGDLLLGQTAYANGAKVTGTMPNRGAVTGIIDQKDDVYTIPNGYHDGSGTVSIDLTEQAKIIPTNIRKDVMILGVVGTMEGSENVHAQPKTATPAKTSQIVTPDTGYDYLTQVTINAIPYTETANTAGGITVTIA